MNFKRPKLTNTILEVIILNQDDESLMHILIEWSRNKVLLHPVKDILEQYERIKGQKYFSNILLISKEFMEEHKNKIKELFCAITENQSKKIVSMKSKLDMDKVFLFENGDHKTDVLILFLQFSNLNTPQNKKYLSKCKDLSSEVIQLLIYAHERQEISFVKTFQIYSMGLKNQKNQILQRQFDVNCVEFAKMACESYDEEIVLFLIKHDDITTDSKVKMLNTICSYGLHQTLRLCMFKFKHQFVDQLKYFEYLLTDYYHDPKYKENINKCIDLLDPMDKYVDQSTRIDSMPSLKSFKNLSQDKITKEHIKEVKCLLHKAHHLEINHAIPKLLEYYIYINNGDTSIVDELSPKCFELFLNSRVKNKDDHVNYISVNLNFLFNYQMDEDCDSKVLKESMNLLEYISNLKNFQHLISHPVLKLYINLMHHKFHFFNVTHCLWIILIILTLLDGITNKNVWMYFWTPLYILIRDAFLFLKIKGEVNMYGLLSVILGCLGMVGMYHNNQLFIVSSAFLIMLATRELFLQLVHLNSNLFLHISMFMKVAAHLRDILYMYLFILVAFAISFHVIYQDEIQQSIDVGSLNKTESISNISLNSKETEEDPKDYEWMFSHFHTPGSAFIKVLVMLTGEFDIANTEMSHWYQFLFFIGFLFFAVTLFNLINALAIEDVHVSSYKV